MNKAKSHQLSHILDNKTLGSSELVQLLNGYLLSICDNKPEIVKTVQLAKTKLRHFEAVASYLNNLNAILKENNKSALINFLKNHSSKENEKIEIIFNRIYPGLKELQSVITLSRSGTLLGILKLWHQKNNKLKVIICESRPKFEGRLMAKELTANGIKVELITDAMIGLYVHKIDTAIIGADIVLKNRNVVNKVGSKALALMCKENKKPFYVVTTHSKFSKKNSFKTKRENSKEIWDIITNNIKISNIYFEEVENKFITKIFTD